MHRSRDSADRRRSREFSSPVGAEKGNEAVLVRSCSPSASGPLGPRPRLSARPLRAASRNRGVTALLVGVVVVCFLNGANTGLAVAKPPAQTQDGVVSPVPAA